MSPTLKNKPPNPKSHNHKTNPLYRTKEWKQASALCLRLNPLCINCGKKARTADHKQPVRLGGSPLDQKNLQSLCKPCHNSKSARDGKKFRKEYNKTKP